MFCSKCGKELPDNTKICPNCGNKTGGGTSITIDTAEIQKKISAASEKGAEAVGKFTSGAKAKSEELLKKAQESETGKKLVENALSAGQKISSPFLAVTVLQALVLIFWFCTFLVVEAEYGMTEKVSLSEMGNPVEKVLMIILLIASIACSAIKTIKKDIKKKSLAIICIITNAWILLMAVTMRILASPKLSDALMDKYAVDDGYQYARTLEAHLTFPGVLLVLISIGLLITWIVQIKKIKNKKKEEVAQNEKN